MSTPSIDQRIERAAVLVEALPFIQRFSGHIIVIKLGGAVDASEAGIDSVLRDIVLLQVVGMRPVVVHGGGAEISAWQQRVGLEPRFVDGLRVTDSQSMEVVKMVLTGKVGPAIVAKLSSLGAGAIGLSGEDGPTLLVRPRDEQRLGFVGEVDQVNPEPVLAVLEQRRIPVVASIGIGYDGQAYNVNADSVAAEVAVALRASKLIMLTDVPGVRDLRGDLISELDTETARTLVDDGAVRGGMIPKVQAATRAADAGVTAHIIDGTLPHALLLELLTEHGVGTMCTPKQPA
jgi:acetylglutamate kinase